jgi:competence protein ComEC
MELLRFALVKIAIAVIAGIVLAHFFAVPSIWWIVSSILLLITNALLYRFFRRRFSVLISLGWILQGLLAGGLSEAIYRQIPTNHYLHYVHYENPNSAQMVLIERLRPGVRGPRFIANVTQINGQESSGKVVLQISDSIEYSIGSKLVFEGNFVRHRAASSPGQFDYGAYLTQKKIFARAYPTTLESRRPVKDYRYLADVVRTKILSKIKAAGFSQSELHVLAALLLGQQTDIDKDTMRDYQMAGAVHILSVSGLHVGFIVIFINALLKPIPKHRNGRLMRLGITIGALWIFAVIAGLSPSVVRSATMFSFLAIGQQMRKPTNSFHTLAASLLVLLLVHPAYLFDVGFQLSYSAVASILWLQPLLVDLWRPSNRILQYFTDIVWVSLAAQIGTMPLSLYYFHQFPGLFLLTNILIIPLVGIIMAVGMTLLVSVAVGFVPHWLVWLTEKLILVLNNTISSVARVDTLVFENIPFHLVLVPICYLTLWIFVRCFTSPTFGRISTALVLVAVLQAGWIMWNQRRIGESEMIVLSSRHPTVVIRHERIIRWMSRSVDTNLMENYRTQFYKPRLTVDSLKNVWSFGTTRILRIDSSGVVPKCTPDVLVISQNPKINPERTITLQRPKLVVIDGSNSRWTTALWKRACINRKIPFHSTYEKGFYKLSRDDYFPSI